MWFGTKTSFSLNLTDRYLYVLRGVFLGFPIYIHLPPLNLCIGIPFECHPQRQTGELIRHHYDSWLGEYIYESFKRNASVYGRRDETPVKQKRMTEIDQFLETQICMQIHTAQARLCNVLPCWGKRGWRTLQNAKAVLKRFTRIPIFICKSSPAEIKESHLDLSQAM